MRTLDCASGTSFSRLFRIERAIRASAPPDAPANVFQSADRVVTTQRGHRVFRRIRIDPAMWWQ